MEAILDFLRRYQFTKAEAAFKAELLAREGGDPPIPSSVNAIDGDVELRLRPLQDLDHSLEGEQTSMSAHERGTRKNSSDQSEETGRILLDRSRSPPKKHLYAHYELQQLECRESLCSSGQEFVFENLRTSPEPEISVSSGVSYFASGNLAAFQVGNPVLEREFENVPATTQGMSWTNPIQQMECSLPRTLSVGSLEDLVEGQARQFTIGSAEQAPTWDDRGIQGRPCVENVTSPFACLGYESQSAEHHELLRNVDMEGDVLRFPGSTLPHRIEKTEFLKHDTHQVRSSLQNEVEAATLDVSAAKGRMDCLEQGAQQMEERDDASLRGGAAGMEASVNNGFIANLVHERSFKDPALKTSLPFSFLKASQEQQSLVRSEGTEPSDQEFGKRGGWVHREVGKIQEPRTVSSGNGEACLGVVKGEVYVDWDGLERCEELPRLPPVRLHFMDKSTDNFKDGGSAAGNSTRSLESAAFRSIGSTPEGSFGWGTFMDVPFGQDVSSSGLKRPISRPSVSQGIVEDMSEQLSGFATAGDGQSESAKEYPDEYCDSDTYEDDDDAGYIRQPIEDEAWFFANEIDYPSDDERARNRVDQKTHNSYKQLGKLEEDDRSFVEEESYLSGEEYYRSQAAKEEPYMSQQSKLTSHEQGQLTYSNLYSTGIGSDLLTLPQGDDGNAYDGQLFDAEELNMMRSEPVWKSFIDQSNDLEQESIVSVGDRLEERHGSVKSGGVLFSSDAADVGSEVRDSLVGGSSEGDLESFRDQEFAAYSPTHQKLGVEQTFSEKQGRHVEVKSAPVRHLDEEDDERGIILQYYNEAWGHTKRTSEGDMTNMDTTGQVVLKNKTVKTKHQTSDSNKVVQDNGTFVFGGFSFPSPSSTGDIAASRAGSGKSLWSNRDSAAQGEETDEYGSGMAGPDDTLAAWKQKSNESSPIICPSEENLPNQILSHHSTASAHTTDEFASLDALKDVIEEPNVGQSEECGQALAADDEDAAAVQDEIRRLAVDVDQYEIFDLKIIHRRNRTGFEEDKDFPVVLNSVIAGRYHATEYLGSAAFSKAIQAHDLNTGMDVCMKIIKNNKDFFDQSLDEIKLLKFVNKHDPADKYHILRLYDYFYHREHLFIVCELLRANLYEFHKFNRESGGEVYFTMPRLQSITRQCLEALEFLHGLGIIHCDLKPENILVKSYSRCEIKIIDLGSSCFQTDHLCSYVQSRSYRAPEVILGLPYDQKIDIWSLGCILAELCSGNVLFQNDSLATLLARVVGILGPIDPEVLAKGRDTYKYFTKNHMLYERNQESDQLEYLLPKKTSLSHRLPMGDQGFVDFVGYLLQNNPAKRPNATEALNHPWLLYPYEPISS